VSRANNTSFQEAADGMIEVVASRDIKAGEELFVSYAREYRFTAKNN
jgi:SET domain-containing protein